MGHRSHTEAGANWQRAAAAAVFLFTLWITAGAGAADPQPIKVDIRAQSSVDQEMIVLGDIARIEGADEPLLGRLRTLPIGRSPLPGGSRIISRADVLVRLKQAGIDSARIRLAAPETARVIRGSVTIEGGQIREIVADFIRRNLADRKGSVTIKEIRVPDKVVLPSGRLRYEVASGPGGDFLGKIAVGVTFRVDESYERKIWATATIEALVDAVVTVRALGRYRPITADDITVRKIDLSDLPANFITDPEEVIGKRTRRALHSDKVLSTDAVELPPLVNRGDMVTMVAQFDGLKITALGQVKRKGRLGERIPVVNLDSRKVVFARVMDANTVAVDF